MKRRLIALLLAAALPSPIPPPQAPARASLPAIRTYDGQFADVRPDDWYCDSVAALYELGLINGQGSDGWFAPEREMTIAEALTMSARLRSLCEDGDCETGPAQFRGDDGEAWYTPYVSYMQASGAIGREFEGLYDETATRAQMAHILANALPQELLEPINADVVAAGYTNRNYIQDVHADTPYRKDILKLYSWGILSGMDQTGAFWPDEPAPRCQVTAMMARLAYSELRIKLPWDYQSAYTRKGTVMEDLIDSDGAFYPAPEPDSREEIDADVRQMLSQGARHLTLNYPAGTLNASKMNQLLAAFLNAVRGYAEQTYNAVQCAYSAKTGVVTLSFGSSLYADSELDRYREETMAYAIEVHDQLWAEGSILPDMAEYDKARVYFVWLCEHCNYDFASTETSMSHTGYNVFAEGAAVCDGYTAAYNLLLKLEGISCTTVSRSDHIWTAAELDGTVYHIDPTWGDQASSIAYRFFGMTETDAMARFS